MSIERTHACRPPLAADGGGISFLAFLGLALVLVVPGVIGLGLSARNRAQRKELKNDLTALSQKLAESEAAVRQDTQSETGRLQGRFTAWEDEKKGLAERIKSVEDWQNTHPAVHSKLDARFAGLVSKEDVGKELAKHAAEAAKAHDAAKAEWKKLDDMLKKIAGELKTEQADLGKKHSSETAKLADRAQELEKRQTRESERLAALQQAVEATRSAQKAADEARDALRAQVTAHEQAAKQSLAELAKRVEALEKKKDAPPK